MGANAFGALFGGLSGIRKGFGENQGKAQVIADRQDLQIADSRFASFIGAPTSGSNFAAILD